MILPRIYKIDDHAFDLNQLSYASIKLYGIEIVVDSIVHEIIIDDKTKIKTEFYNLLSEWTKEEIILDSGDDPILTKT